MMLPIPESPKFKYAKNDFDEARRILGVIAKYNGVKFPKAIVFDKEKVLNKENSLENSLVNSQGLVWIKGNISEICKFSNIRQNFFCFLIIYASAHFCDFLINFQLKNVPGSLLYLTFVTQIAEFLAFACSGYAFKVLGAKPSFILMFTITIISSTFLYFYWHASPNLLLILISSALFGAAGAFMLCFICFMQFFPTILSPTIFGFCNTLARLTSTMTTEVAELDYKWSIYVNLGLCTVSILASSLIVIKKNNK